MTETASDDDSSNSSSSDEGSSGLGGSGVDGSGSGSSSDIDMASSAPVPAERAGGRPGVEGLEEGLGVEGNEEEEERTLIKTLVEDTEEVRVVVIGSVGLGAVSTLSYLSFIHPSIHPSMVANPPTISHTHTKQRWTTIWARRSR